MCACARLYVIRSICEVIFSKFRGHALTKIKSNKLASRGIFLQYAATDIVLFSGL